MDFHEATEILLKAYGKHMHAAKALGMAGRHYRALRNGTLPLSDRTRKYVIMMAENVLAGSPEGGVR